MKDKNYVLVLIGQIISLFGNAMLRFALPQHLLIETGSPALYGWVNALAFLPLLIMSPLGGAVTDRVNKRNIMVGLDFFTAALTLGFLTVESKVNPAAGIGVMLFLLSGISGAYQPAVQASIPWLVPEERLTRANAGINMVSSLSGFLGPVLGGVCYSMLGLKAVLLVSGVCIFFSAVMELFIRIPTVKQAAGEGIFLTMWKDLKESIHFIVKEKPEVGKVTVCVAAFNLFLSALIIVGVPVVITQVLVFEKADSSTMVGYAQGILAVGGLAGGVFSGILGEKQRAGDSWIFLFLAGVFLLPAAWGLGAGLSTQVVYPILCVCSFLVMAAATMFTVCMMAYIQRETPGELIGKVIAWVIAIATCAQPLGQTLYGICFEAGVGKEGVIFAGGAVMSVGIAFVYGKIFKKHC